jgi:serine protease inhibitor
LRGSGLLALICLAGFSALADTQADQDSLTAANTGFAFDLLKQIAGKQPGGNVFISPYSVSTVLQMVDDGAAGRTKQEMESVLHVTRKLASAGRGLQKFGSIHHERSERTSL